MGFIPRLILAFGGHMITRVLSILRVATAKIISSILYPDAKNPHSKIVQTQRQLNTLVLLGKIKRGPGWYAVNEYKGNYGEHDRLLTELTARLARLKLPISVYREHSFPIGIRSDLVILIGKGNKAICAVIEAKNQNETPAYLAQKITAWLHWTEAPQYLSNLFGTNIPHFSIITEGISHPLAVDFQKFIKEVSNV
jgi:hypothetical protein